MGRDGLIRLVLAGGGTGGHIYPALAIAARLKELCPMLDLLYIGTAQGLEARLVPRSGLPFRTITARGVVGKGLAGSLKGVLAAGAGVGQAAAILRNFMPHLVLGTGGYVSGPVLLAAALLRFPIAIQEQNAIPGVTNRLMSRFAKLVLVGYEEAVRYFPKGTRVVAAGNPVRHELLAADRWRARQSLGVGDAERLVVIFMGSRGSATVNTALLHMIPSLAGRPGLRLLVASGEDHFSRFRRMLEGLGSRGATPANIEIRPYIHDMVTALAAADLVVCRAGAITLAEVTARGLPAIIIPSPYVTHDHQTKNAQALAEKGAAVVLPERELSGERLAGEIIRLVEDPARLGRMAAASRQMGRAEALDVIVEELWRTFFKKGGTPCSTKR